MEARQSCDCVQGRVLWSKWALLALSVAEITIGSPARCCRQLAAGLRCDCEHGNAWLPAASAAPLLDCLERGTCARRPPIFLIQMAHAGLHSEFFNGLCHTALRRGLRMKFGDDGS